MCWTHQLRLHEPSDWVVHGTYQTCAIFLLCFRATWFFGAAWGVPQASWQSHQFGNQTAVLIIDRVRNKWRMPPTSLERSRNKQQFKKRHTVIVLPVSATGKQLFLVVYLSLCVVQLDSSGSFYVPILYACNFILSFWFFIARIICEHVCKDRNRRHVLGATSQGRTYTGFASRADSYGKIKCFVPP